MMLLIPALWFLFFVFKGENFVRVSMVKKLSISKGKERRYDRSTSSSYGFLFDEGPHFPQLGLVLLNGWKLFVQPHKSVRHFFHLYWNSLSDCEHFFLSATDWTQCRLRGRRRPVLALDEGLREA